MNTSQKGNIATAHILAALVANGKDVAIPFGDHQRYDLIIDDNGTFLRVQCKVGCLKDGQISFMTSRHRRRVKDRPAGWISYRGEVDLFGVYCPQNRTCYLVPANEVKEKRAFLRLAPTRNNQKKGVRRASAYEIGAVAQLGERCNGIAEVRGSIPLGSTKRS